MSKLKLQMPEAITYNSPIPSNISSLLNLIDIIFTTKPNTHYSPFRALISYKKIIYIKHNCKIKVA